MKNDYQIFAGEVVKAKYNKKLTNKDLAEMTGYSKRAIERFFDGTARTDNVARALSKALDLPL